MARQNHELVLTDPSHTREAQIARIAESKEDIAALREHLQKIVECKSFRGSHRSVQFLVYIVDQAMAGHFDSLKERMIGIELFGRAPSYDTGEDAIVRVTASDVRRRLLQYYGENGRTSKFFINLHSGSYVPEIIRNTGGVTEPKPAEILLSSLEARISPKPSEIPDALSHESNHVHHDVVLPFPAHERSIEKSGRRKLIGMWGLGWSLGILCLALALVAGSIYWLRSQHAAGAAVSSPPWAALINSSHATHIITSDPNIVHVQELAGNSLSISDYANRQYLPEPNKLSPAELKILRLWLQGDNSASAVDTPIALKIQALTGIEAKRIDAHPARSIQLADLKSDDNFIFIGSPRSNPWTSLFADQLDFRFVFDKARNEEIIENLHPRVHEAPEYIPTAPGWATGQSYAIIAYVQNPDQNGQVLLLAGADGEGTEAAGDLVTNLPRLTAALARCSTPGGKPLQHFEMLLGLHTMAGSPNDVDVLACHLLTGASSH